MAHPTHHASKARSLAARLTHTSSNRSGGGVAQTHHASKAKSLAARLTHTSSSRSRSGVAPTDASRKQGQKPGSTAQTHQQQPQQEWCSSDGRITQARPEAWQHGSTHQQQPQQEWCSSNASRKQG